MSRSGYSDDCEHIFLWRGAVERAILGKRGQAFLRDLGSALDALPERRLIAGALEAGPEVCAIGALGRVRGVDMSRLDPEDSEGVANAFGIARALACEIVWENDEVRWRDTPEERWTRMREWVRRNVAPVAPTEGGE